MKDHCCWNCPQGEIAEIVDKGATVEFGEDIVAFVRHLERRR
jgi:hypothetical protein